MTRFKHHLRRRLSRNKISLDERATTTPMTVDDEEDVRRSSSPERSSPSAVDHVTSSDPTATRRCETRSAGPENVSVSADSPTASSTCRVEDRTDRPKNRLVPPKEGQQPTTSVVVAFDDDLINDGS